MRELIIFLSVQLWKQAIGQLLATFARLALEFVVFCSFPLDRQCGSHLDQGASRIFGLIFLFWCTLALSIESDTSLSQLTTVQKYSKTVFLPWKNPSEDSEVRQNFSLHLVFPPLSRGWLLSQCSPQWPTFPPGDAACNEIKMEGQSLATLQRALAKEEGCQCICQWDKIWVVLPSSNHGASTSRPVYSPL